MAAAAEKSAAARRLIDRLACALAELCSGGPYEAADVAVWRRSGVAQPLEVRVAIIGNVDSGKSTIVGVMTRRWAQLAAAQLVSAGCNHLQSKLVLFGRCM